MRRFPTTWVIGFLLLSALPAGGLHAQNQPLRYPPTKKIDVVERHFGVGVADPYRWLEALEDPATGEWSVAQQAVTAAYLGRLPLRERFRKRITELWSYPKVSLPVPEGGRLFYRKNTGLQRQSVLYMRTSLAGEPRLVLDPNTLSPDGSVALSAAVPSPDAKLLAYGLSQGGADWRTMRVRSLETGRDFPDSVRWVRFSGVSWTRDGKGFFYSRYPEPPSRKVLEAALTGHALYYHRVGTPQSEDRLVYERKDLPTWVVGGRVTEDGQYLLISLARGADPRNRLYYADLGDPLRPDLAAPVRPQIKADDAEYQAFGNRGPTLFVRTDARAPNRKVVAVDLRNPDPARWRTVVPEGKHPLEKVAMAKDRIVGLYLVDVTSTIRLFGLDGRALGQVELPGVGSVTGLSGRPDGSEFFYTFTSPLAPAMVFAYNVRTGRGAPFEAPRPPFDPGGYETTQHFAVSKDGTRVPYSVTARKGVTLDGRNPTLLYAYGGFAITILPAYRADVPAWLELGGVYVTANLRGGGEYGEAWHRAGMREQKQRVFDDFIAVAEALIRTGYTSPARLAIRGGSNGGLLVGAAMTQRPDLFAVALPAVGVLDMLRYDKFTGGGLWTSEYGSPADSAAFRYLYAYSPLHNVRAGTCYPATLVTTADHDDRVVPSHSYKFSAALQAAQGCGRPVLLRVETQGSHGYRPTDNEIAELADVWAFTAAHTGTSGDVPP
jgi:prolyl oligopeptidase